MSLAGHPRSEPFDRRVVRFGVFEFDLAATRLSRNQREVSLQQQPAMLLALLVQRGGKVVTRDELRDAIWPSGTFVEFDLSLNTAISRLRRVLSDSATEPRFIETVPKQGYRFIAPLEYVLPTPSAGPELLPDPEEPVPEADHPVPRSRGTHFWIAGGTTVLAVSILLAIYYSRRVPVISSGPVMRFTLTLPPGHRISMLELSPAGNQIVYDVNDTSGRKLFRRFLDEEQSRVIPGSENGEQPFFSPDGKEVGFYTPGSLRIAGASGTRDLTPVKAGFGLRRAVWGEDGAIYYTSVDRSPGQEEVPGLWRIPAAGGKPTLVLPFEQLEKGTTVYFPQQIFGGSRPALLYSTNTGPLRRSIEWLDLGGSGRRASTRLIERGMGGQILASGHLLYAWNGRLIAAPFDESTRSLKGSSVEVLADVALNAWRGPQASVSRNGTLAYVPERRPLRQLVWVDRTGKEQPLTLPAADYEQAEVSPDGRILLVRRDESSRWTVWTYSPGSNSWTRLAETMVPRPRAIWMPDGKSIIAALARGDEEFVNLYRIPLDAPDKIERLSEQPDFGQFPLSVNAAGDNLLYVEGVRPKTQSDILSMSLSAGHRTRTLVATAAPDRGPAFSPDGRWFAYATQWQSGSQVWVQPFPQTEQAEPVQVGNGIDPLWSRDGQTLFFLGAGSCLMEVTFDRNHTPGPTRQILPPGFAVNQDWWTRAYSLAPDGRFLVIRHLPGSRPASDQIHVVANWLEELRRLVPLR